MFWRRKKTIESGSGVKSREIRVKGYKVDVFFVETEKAIFLGGYNPPEEWPFDQARGAGVVVEAARKVFKKKVETGTELNIDEQQPRGFKR